MRRAIRIAGLVWLLAAANFASVAEGQSLEYRVKAAFLLNFTRFVEWPAASFPNDKSPISICVVGEDPFGPVLDEVVNDETVNQHKLFIRRVRQPPAPGSCQVVYFEKQDKDSKEMLASLGPGVLTVGEGEAFLHEGGVIAFVLENRRVRFEVNRGAAAKADLKMNAKLLSVARSVEN